MRKPEDVSRVISDSVNRSRDQGMFLFDLCGRDPLKLLQLEHVIKAKNLFICPGTTEEVDQLLKRYSYLHNTFKSLLSHLYEEMMDDVVYPLSMRDKDGCGRKIEKLLKQL